LSRYAHISQVKTHRIHKPQPYSAHPIIRTFEKIVKTRQHSTVINRLLSFLAQKNIV
jgi:hypothetical protein